MARIAQDEPSGNPHLGRALTSYCFGDLSDQERDLVEEHLMSCDACWEQFQQMDAAVRTLRLDAAVRSAMPASEVVSLLGMSSQLDRPFGGHVAFVAAAAIMFGAIWTLGLWSELGYAYDRFGAMAWRLSLPVGVWTAGSVAVTLALAAKAARARRTDGLRRALACLFVLMGIMVVLLMAVLPAERTIDASFQTRTASGGYLKDVIVVFLPLVLFVVPPFDAVIRLQRELRAGRGQQVIAFLRDETRGVRPRGMWYVSPRALTLFLLVSGVVKIVGMNHMLDALDPGRYANLFSVVSNVSTGLWLALGMLCIAWYSGALNELKREALALSRIDRSDADGPISE